MDATELRDSAVQAINDGRLDAARPLWSGLCELEPLETDNWLILSAIDEKLGFLPAALGHLRYAFHLSPDDPDVWLKAAEIKWQMQQFDAALADLCQALALDFTDADVRLRLAGWLGAGCRFEQAAMHYDYLCRAGAPMTPGHLVDGLCCAWLAGNTGLLSRLLQHPGVDYPVELAAMTARRARVLAGPNASSSGDEPAGIDDQDVLYFCRQLRSVLDQPLSAADRTALLEVGIHTEDWIRRPGEALALSNLSALAATLIGNRGGNVVEFACGTGRLGAYIKRHCPDVVLTGTDPLAAALQCANRKGHYDNLVQWPDEGPTTLNSDSQSRLILIAGRAGHYTNRRALLAELLKGRGRDTPIALVFGPDNGDVREITAGLSSFAIRHRWHTLSPWPDEWLALVIDDRLPDPGGLFLRRQSRDQASEAAGNLLIHATSLLSRLQYEQARAAADKVLEAFPNSSGAKYISGVGHQHDGKPDSALQSYRQALKTCRGFADCWFQIGTVYQQQDRAGPARRAYEVCLKSAPGHPVAGHNLILLLMAAGDKSAAFNRITRRLAGQPLNDELPGQTRALIKATGEQDLLHSLEEFLSSAQWLDTCFNAALNSKYFDRCKALLAQLEGIDGSHDCAFMAARLDEKTGNLRNARRRLNRLIDSNPENTVYLQSQASVCAAQGLIKSAYRGWLKTVKHAEATNPNLQNMLFFSNYCQFLTDRTLFHHHRRWGKALADALNTERAPAQVHDGHNKIIRIGYVSGDFRMHSVSLFFYNILKFHDRDRFTVYCYSSTPAEDNMTIKLRLFSDYWRQIQHMKDDEAVALIRRDGIDILVDLSGHTASNRLPLFCRRPAPVQCTYLGYANTTGLEEIDYRITDNEADPEGMTEHLHTEKLVRLPSGFLSYSRHFGSSPVTVYRDEQRRRRYTFACCNNVLKVNENVIRVWCEILNRLPDATLLIKSHNLDNTEILARYRSLFGRHGIGEKQVHLMNTIDIAEHQNLYNDVDIALDPFPYNGTTTTCDALWMGVPVLALAGSRHAGRVGVSILTRVGLTDWIAADEQDYVEKAVKFARDRALLARLKLGMRDRMLNSSLMRPGAVTRDLEAVYIEICNRSAAASDFGTMS